MERHGTILHSGIFLGGLMLGGMIAAAATLFMAPMSGKKMRGQVKRMGIDLRDQAAERADDVQKNAQHMYKVQSKKLRRQAMQAKDNALNRAQDVQKRGMKAVQKNNKRMLGRTSSQVGRRVLNRVMG